MWMSYSGCLGNVLKKTLFETLTLELSSSITWQIHTQWALPVRPGCRPDPAFLLVFLGVN
jgi:hypothetical protein